jgi:hypothetical protein
LGRGHLEAFAQENYTRRYPSSRPVEQLGILPYVGDKGGATAIGQAPLKLTDQLRADTSPLCVGRHDKFAQVRTESHVVPTHEAIDGVVIVVYEGDRLRRAERSFQDIRSPALVPESSDRLHQRLDPRDIPSASETDHPNLLLLPIVTYRDLCISAAPVPVNAATFGIGRNLKRTVKAVNGYVWILIPTGCD